MLLKTLNPIRKHINYFSSDSLDSEATTLAKLPWQLLLMIGCRLSTCLHEIVGTAFLDLSKAFDLVDNRMLLQKLKACQFSGGSLQWFKSYFELRSQQVSISWKTINFKTHIIWCVTRISFGATSFLDIHQWYTPRNQKSIIDIFVDDTILSRSGSSDEQVTDDLNEGPQYAVTWCVKNKTSVDSPKIKAMFVSSIQYLIFWKFSRYYNKHHSSGNFK